MNRIIKEIIGKIRLVLVFLVNSNVILLLPYCQAFEIFSIIHFPLSFPVIARFSSKDISNLFLCVSLLLFVILQPLCRLFCSSVVQDIQSTFLQNHISSLQCIFHLLTSQVLQACRNSGSI